MRVSIDTEFIEDGKTIGLISIGLVAEDGREYYAVNADMPSHKIADHEWLMDNVVPGLPKLHGDVRQRWIGSRMARRSNPLCLDRDHRDIKPSHWIAEGVRSFLRATPDLELWAWYAAFDHVALAWLFGPMSDLPTGIPMWTNDIRQECARLGLTDADMPQQEDGVHNALADARHNLVRLRYLDQVADGLL